MALVFRHMQPLERARSRGADRLRPAARAGDLPAAGRHQQRASAVAGAAAAGVPHRQWRRARRRRGAGVPAAGLRAGQCRHEPAHDGAHAGAARPAADRSRARPVLRPGQLHLADRPPRRRSGRRGRRARAGRAGGAERGAQRHRQRALPCRQPVRGPARHRLGAPAVGQAAARSAARRRRQGAGVPAAQADPAHRLRVVPSGLAGARCRHPGQPARLQADRPPA